MILFGGNAESDAELSLTRSTMKRFFRGQPLDYGGLEGLFVWIFELVTSSYRGKSSKGTMRLTSLGALEKEESVLP